MTLSPKFSLPKRNMGYKKIHAKEHERKKSMLKRMGKDGRQPIF